MRSAGLVQAKGLEAPIVLADVADDGVLEIGDDWNTPSSEAPRGEETLDGIDPGTSEVGVKWNTQGGCRSSQARTLGSLWVAWLSAMAGISLPAGTARSTALRKRTNSWCRCCGMQRPSEVPSRTLSAANTRGKLSYARGERL